MTAGGIVGIVVGAVLGASYLYCCFISARKAIRDRRAMNARNAARRKARAFREHHQAIAKKFKDVTKPEPIAQKGPLFSIADGGSKMSIISGEGVHHPRPAVYLSGRRRSSTSLPPNEVAPKLTRLPHKKFAITRDSVEASMARDNAARPPSGLVTAPSAFRHGPPGYSDGPYGLPPGKLRHIPLAMREESLDDSSSVSSYMSGSHSFRRRNSYEHAMRKTHLPPITHPLRDKRTAAAKAARAVRIIEQLKEEDEARKRDERERREEGEEAARRIEEEEEAAADGYGGYGAAAAAASSRVPPSNSSSSMNTPLTGKLPLWIHPDVGAEGYRNSGYSEADSNNYL